MILGSLVTQFANGFHSWLHHSWKSFANRLSDSRWLMHYSLYRSWKCIWKCRRLIAAILPAKDGEWVKTREIAIARTRVEYKIDGKGKPVKYDYGWRQACKTVRGKVRVRDLSILRDLSIFKICMYKKLKSICVHQRWPFVPTKNFKMASRINKPIRKILRNTYWFNWCLCLVTFHLNLRLNISQSIIFTKQHLRRKHQQIKQTHTTN